MRETYRTYSRLGDAMRAHVDTFLTWMDTKNWVRISVCLVPGLVVSKLAGQLDAPEGVRLTGTVLLVLGAIVWLAWDKLRAMRNGEDDEVIEEVVLAPESHGNTLLGRPETTVADLLAAYEGDGDAALRAIQMEIAVSPDIAAATAVDRAARRKRAENTLSAQRP
jgi:hypothetical protein